MGIMLGLMLSFDSAVYPAFAGKSLLEEKFDHAIHTSKVFNPLRFECSKCHNFSLEESSGKLVPHADLEKSAFRISLREMCHQCHQSAESRFAEAPKACYNCHSSPSGLSAIKPDNHNNGSWKSWHSLEARVAGESCLNCHTTSQCVKCHTQRNDITQRNHPRNFRVTHSIQARMQPQRCDACHTKSYCTNCHMGAK